jgi:hypothetical protein
MLRANFAFQYPRRVAGILNRPQLWACQKHPRTSMIFRCRGRTMSGLPGNSGTCSRNLYPSRCTIRRTINSGVVFFDRIAAMQRDRWDGVRVSGIVRAVDAA